MAKPTYTYWVTGVGQFPTDMLRYDRGKAIYAMEQGKRVFHLIHGENRPTEGRWTSFLWSVIQTEEQCFRWNLPHPEAVP